MNLMIITAGGAGKRMNLGYNKIFAKLDGAPVIVWVLETIEKSSVIDKVVISTKKTDIPRLKKLLENYKFSKLIRIIPSDMSRQASTYRVLRWIKKNGVIFDLVGVHNGVNPFTSLKEIEDVFYSAKKYGAALLAQPARDTVKISDDQNSVSYTPVRKYCWYAQTPQVASFEDLYKAFYKAEKEKFAATDDTQLLERIGIKAKIVPCSNLNFKITYVEDLDLAKSVAKFFKR